MLIFLYERHLLHNDDDDDSDDSDDADDDDSDDDSDDSDDADADSSLNDGIPLIIIIDDTIAYQ